MACGAVLGWVRLSRWPGHWRRGGLPGAVVRACVPMIDWPSLRPRTHRTRAPGPGVLLSAKWYPGDFIRELLSQSKTGDSRTDQRATGIISRTAEDRFPPGSCVPWCPAAPGTGAGTSGSLELAASTSMPMRRPCSSKSRLIMPSTSSGSQGYMHEDFMRACGSVRYMYAASTVLS